jgi:hypothetical protein
MMTDSNTLTTRLQPISDGTSESSKIIETRNPADFKYFAIGKHWTNKIKPVIESQEAQNILHHDFKKYSKSKQRDINNHYKDMGLDKKAKFSFKKNDMPCDLDGGGWRYYRIGRPPAYDSYVCKGACHWVANALLYTATKAFPKTQWQIVTSDKHSTVWDGKVTFFDLNYLAMQITPEVCFENTFMADGLTILPVGQYLYCH